MESDTDNDQWGQARTNEPKRHLQITEEQLVRPPKGLSYAQTMEWLYRDLIEAIGAEFVDSDGSQQPFTRPKKVNVPKDKPKPQESPQGELLL